MSATEAGLRLKYVAEPMPFAPEPFAAIVGRWPQAMAVTHELEAVQAGRQTTPAFKRENVFDFEDGTRLIASVEVAEAGPQLHLSFGIYSLHHADWILRGRAAWKQHITRIMAQLVVAGCITGDITDRHITQRAEHYWFTI